MIPDRLVALRPLWTNVTLMLHYVAGQHILLGFLYERQNQNEAFVAVILLLADINFCPLVSCMTCLRTDMFNSVIGLLCCACGV